MTRRLLISYLLLTAFVLAVVELPLGLTYAGRQQDRLIADVERDARVLAGLVEERVEADDTSGVASISTGYAEQTGGRVVVTDDQGVSLVDTSRPKDPPRDFSTRPEIRTALSGTQRSGIRASTTLGQELAYVAVPITSGSSVNGAVRVSFPTDTLRKQVRDNWLRLGLLSVLVLAAAASLGWLVSRWAMSPVSELEVGAQRLASGDLSARAEVERGPPELRRLGVAFNDMAAQVEGLVGAQRAFVADASHQLRTPLTALRLRLDELEELLADGDVESARPEVDAISAEVGRLGQLVEGLLALARAEAGTGAISPTRVDVAAVVRDAAQRWEALTDERQVRVVVDAPPQADGRALPGALEQVMDNLLDNALEVAPPGTTIDLTVTPDPRGVGIRVRDHGGGMSEQDRERATHRFWRAPDAPAGGTGLGLAIVSELVRVSGGTVALGAPTDGTGLVVDVHLPRA
jgi:signal transduction histidine kinase